jgi:putative drug exporter of the RND superfamily
VLTRLARFLIRQRKPVLVGALLFVLVAGAFGGNVASRLSAGGFDDQSLESSRAQDLLRDNFGQSIPNMVLLVTARDGDVDSAAVAQAGQALTATLANEDTIDQAVSYWSLGSPPPLKSKDGKQAIVLAFINGTQDEVDDHITDLSPRYTYTANEGPLKVEVGGFAEVFRQAGNQIEKDLQTAEAIAFPIVLILLVLVFGSVVAASLPLGIGILAILGTFLTLRILSSFTEVSVYSLNMTTAMGLGLAVDYSLFVVSRYREELRKGKLVYEAIERTLETAGRTVLISALTVAVSLSALLVFPLTFFKSFAYAGIPTVLLAAVGTVIVLPAMLATLGRRVDKLTLWKHEPKEVGEGFWHRLAVFVMRRPVVTGGAVVVLLLFLGAPFLRIQLGLPDDRILHTSQSARQVSDELRANFASEEANALTVVATGVDPVAERGAIDAYANKLALLPGVARVDAATGTYFEGAQLSLPEPLTARFRPIPGGTGTWLSVVPSVEPVSSAGEKLVRDIRNLDAGFDVVVGGSSAQLVDAKKSMFSRMPWALGLIAVTTFVLLFLMFGSILVPVKALVLNLLSLSATYGAMVWIFQEGHLSGLLDFTATGQLVLTSPILMFCIAFGLSMDYEVFLLSRIKEEYDLTGDNEHSVAVGLERTGRIVTAAAALLAVVFIAFAASKISFIQLFGLGLTLAVIMDATLIRGVLVPAFMRLAGNANWWAPRSLRRFQQRWGISDSSGEAELVVHGPTEPARDLVSAP